MAINIERDVMQTVVSGPMRSDDMMICTICTIYIATAYMGDADVLVIRCYHPGARVE